MLALQLRQIGREQRAHVRAGGKYEVEHNHFAAQLCRIKPFVLLIDERKVGRFDIYSARLSCFRAELIQNLEVIG